MVDTRQAPTEMYHMKPLHQVDQVELPTTMYHMKSLHNNDGPECSDPDMKTLVEKDRKIANDLVALTSEVKELSRRLGHKFGETPQGFVKQASATTTGTAAPISLPDGITDLVISTSIAQPAFSAVLIGEIIKSNGVHVATVTQKHSSLVGEVPENYLAVTGGLGGRIQHSIDKLVFTFQWKGDALCPSLMDSPREQTRIVGDANIARYLCRILLPHLYNEDDVENVLDIDKWIETSVQLSNGSSKEKDAAVKAMNSHLGKCEYFCNESVTVADVTLLAALLANAGHVKSLPKNVKKWFATMASCFGTTLSRFNVPASWTAQ